MLKQQVTIEEVREDLRYLRLLARDFPTVSSVSTEIINLEAILHLPKPTEHFLADLHGGRTAEGLKKYQQLCQKEDLLIILGDVCLKLEPTEENADFTERFLSVK